MSVLSASRVYLVISLATSLANSLMYTTCALYYVNLLHLNPLQLVLVGTFCEVTVMLAEVPTGVVADAYSRRLSAIIGTLVMGAAYLLEGAVPWLGGILPLFAGVVLAEMVRGLGWTFISGAQEAWVADEVGQANLGPLLLRTANWSRVAGMAGIGLSVVLANVALNLPFLVGGVLILLLALFMWLTMQEHGFKPEPREGRTTWQVLSGTFTAGITAVRGRPVLIALLVLSVVGGAASEGYARLWEAHLLTTFSLADATRLTPATWFGLLGLAGSMLGITIGWATHRWVNLADQRVVTVGLVISGALRVGFLFAYATAPNLYWAVGFMLACWAAGSVHDPLYGTWVNGHVDSKVRATVLSLMGQMDALGQSGGGPLVGWVGARSGIRAAMGLAAVLAAPALGVYTWAFRRERKAASVQVEA